MNRRTFLSAAATSAAAAAYLPMWARTLPTIGVQLYTVRSVMPAKPEETLKAIDDIGYREVEAIMADVNKMVPLIKAAQLNPVSLHLDFALFAEGKEKELDQALADAKRNGFQYVVCPYVPPPQRAGLEGMRKLSQRLNAAGSKAKAQGMQLCYHNHAFEFEPLEGTTPLAVLLQETKPAELALEMDVFWVSVAGHDPVDMLKQHKGRVPLLHLKDKDKGLATQYNEQVPKQTFREVGHGSLDFPAILKQASSSGVKHYFVEQDQTPGDPLASLRDSYNYLHTLNY